MGRPKTYKESFERVCAEYAEYKTYSNIKIHTLLFIIAILLSILIGLFIFYINGGA